MRHENQAHRGRRPGTTNNPDWRAIVDAFRRSGLTRRAFCHERGIPLSTLNWWLTRARRAPRKPPITFTELQLPLPVAAPAPPPHPWRLEIVLADGVTIRSCDPIPAWDVRRLLRTTRC
jgi:hypothetical protein